MENKTERESAELSQEGDNSQVTEESGQEHKPKETTQGGWLPPRSMADTMPRPLSPTQGLPVDGSYLHFPIKSTTGYSGETPPSVPVNREPVHTIPPTTSGSRYVSPAAVLPYPPYPYGYATGVPTAYTGVPPYGPYGVPAPPPMNYPQYSVPPVGGIYGMPVGSVTTMENTQQPLSVLGKRPLTQEENRQVQKAVNASSSSRIWQYSIPLGVFMVFAYVLAFDSRLLAVILPILLGTLLLYAVGTTLYYLRMRRERQKEGVLRQTLDSGDSVVEMYADRLVSISSQCQLTMYYVNVRQFVEMPNLLALVDTNGRCITIRAADCIPYDAQRIKDVFYARLMSRQRKYKGTFLPQLQTPLPIPIIQNTDETIHSLQMEKGIDKVGVGLKTFLSQAVGLPLSAQLAVMWATDYQITTSIKLDTLLFYGILLLMFLVILGARFWIAMRRRFQQGDLCVAFTKQGIATSNRGYTAFFPWSQIYTKRMKHALAIELVLRHEKQPLMVIPWRDIPDREALTDLLHKHGC